MKRADLFAVAEDSHGPYTIVRSYIWVPPVAPSRERVRAHFVYVYDARRPSSERMWNSAFYTQADDARLLWLRMTTNIPATIMAIQLGLPVDSGINTTVET